VKQDLPSPTRLQLIRGVNGLKVAAAAHGLLPSLVIGTALRVWCRRSFPKVHRTTLPTSQAVAKLPEVNAWVELLERLPFFEAAYWLSTAYAGLIPEARRVDLAMYFTPPRIADRLVDDLRRAGVRFEADRFVDPACGGAAFLAVVATRMRRALRRKGYGARKILTHAQKHLAGFDVDSVLCALSQQFLQMVFYREICETGQSPKFNIVRENSLNSIVRLRRRFDVVLCNPPFRKLAPSEASVLRSRFAHVMQGQPNLYAVFVDAAEKLVRTGGLVGLVTPTSYLSGQYFGALRTFLLEHASVMHIGIVSDREGVYLDVQQETALTTFRTRTTANKGRPRTAVSIVESDGTYQRVGYCYLPNSGTSWPIPRETDDVRLLDSALLSPYRLQDYGYTPSIGGFVWNRDARPVFMTANKVPKKRRSTAVPLLWSSDVGSDGAILFPRKRAGHNQHHFVDYGDVAHPTVCRQPGVLLQRVTSNDQTRRLVGASVSQNFIRRYRGYVGENHTVILKQTAPKPSLTPRQMVRLLQADVVDRYFRCISGSTNVSSFELGQLPLPNPTRLRERMANGESIELAAQRELLRRGRQ
jgi:adenine-specific DNA-methyltransferase